MTILEPGAAIPIASVPNLRDLGGWVGMDGRQVRHGLVFRSTELAGLTDADQPALDALGLRAVLDLRTEAERQAQPDAQLPGAAYVVLDVLADTVGAAPAQLLHLMDDPAGVQAMLGDGKAAELLRHAYGDIVTLPSARRAYHDFFTLLAGSDHRPALFHCTTGKDRTGWGSACLLMMLGVCDDDVMAEYLLTNAQLLPALQPLFDRFAVAGGDPDLLRPLLGVEADYLQAALAAMRETYGTLDTYLTDGLQLDASVPDRLRTALLTG